MIGIRNKEAIRLFGISIRQKRLQKGFSQEEFAYQCGVDTRQIGRIERGEVNTTISTIFTLAKALDLAVAELFDFSFPSSEQNKDHDISE